MKNGNASFPAIARQELNLTFLCKRLIVDSKCSGTKVTEETPGPQDPFQNKTKEKTSDGFEKMDLAAAGLKRQPFRGHGEAHLTVSYGGYRDALDMLEATAGAPRGLALLQGPALSGKRTVLRDFLVQVPSECAVAVVDGSGLDSQSLLREILRGFGYPVEFDSTRELLAMTRVFALQQAASYEAPVLVVENAHALTSAGWHTLNELAELRLRASAMAAMKLVLMSHRALGPFLTSEALTGIRRRVTSDFHMRPMSRDEAREYLHQKLSAAGSDVPEFVFPGETCDALWAASGGWPGILDRCALLSLARADTLPVETSGVISASVPAGTWEVAGDAPASTGQPDLEPPTLYLEKSGRIERSVPFAKSRLLVGRSEHNDISIVSRVVSRHHLLLVRSGHSTFLMDLNSTNGTYVNARRVSNCVLADGDVIALGQHSLRFSDPAANRRAALADADFADPEIMQTVEEMRSLLESEDTANVPQLSEELPTFGNHAS